MIDEWAAVEQQIQAGQFPLKFRGTQQAIDQALMKYLRGPSGKITVTRDDESPPQSGWTRIQYQLHTSTGEHLGGLSLESDDDQWRVEITGARTSIKRLTIPSAEEEAFLAKIKDHEARKQTREELKAAGYALLRGYQARREKDLLDVVTTALLQVVREANDADIIGDQANSNAHLVVPHAVRRGGPSATPEETKRKYVQGWFQVKGTVTQEAYCDQKGFATSTLRKWIREFEAKGEAP